MLDSQKRVFSWGFGGYGRLGHSEQKDEMVPRLVKLFDFPGRGASQICTGYQCSFAISEMGEKISRGFAPLFTHFTLFRCVNSLFSLQGGYSSGGLQTLPETRPCTPKPCRICVDGRSAVWRAGECRPAVGASAPLQSCAVFCSSLCVYPTGRAASS